jgi:hypothetical protein
MKKYLVITMLMLAVSCFALVGCDALEILGNNLSICTLVNCEELGIVDITGPNNTLIETEPNYNLDPTCTIPGLCGANPWYPYSTADEVASTTTGS